MRHSGVRTPSSPWGWAVSGMVLGGLGAVLLFAPARWLGGLVSQVSGGQLTLDDPLGSVWDGSARVKLTGGAGSLDAASLPGRMVWRLRPAYSSGPVLALQLQADCCLTQPWVWRLSPGWRGAALAFSDHQSQWPAQWLSGLGTPWNTIQAQGQLALHTQGLHVNWVQGRVQLSGNARLDALDMASRLSTLRPMGSYRVSLNGGAAPELLLATLSGQLQLSGRGEWVGGKLRFVGEASSAPESQAALSNLLNIIGRRSGERSFIKLG
ncbi:MAG: type II secretion system protein N [Rhodoferax sp.]|uniref:type II secretion system protein N n=1 Tax=Rhodoferax sp. TaxID=50421 RepID=UPI001B7A571B|nr:type II secretion system protein N [Rhodoferax sp.]MBP9905616.1 type II secretion system protein N [Rhodoferax sp.]